MRMQHCIRRFPALWRATRLARRWYHARCDAYPDWQRDSSAEAASCGASARAAAQGGPRVLMATAIGSYAHAVTLESALAAALTFRGAEVHALLCDGAMTACAECEASLYPEHRALRRARTVARSVPRLPVAGRARLRAARDHGPPLRRLADGRRSRRARAASPDAADGGRSDVHARRPGDRRARATPARCGSSRPARSTDEPHGEAIVRRYLESALLTALRHAAAAAQRPVHVGGVHARHLRAVGHRRRGGAPGGRARLDLERRLPQAPLHLQPRRHLPPHAADRAARALGGPRAVRRARSAS